MSANNEARADPSKITLGPSPALTGDQAHNPRAAVHFDLLRPLIPYLPAQVSLVISNHDMGNSMPSAELRSSLLDHVARGKWIDVEELARLENPKHVGTGILLSCAPDSPARKSWDNQRAAGVSKLHDASFSGGEPKSQGKPTSANERQDADASVLYSRPLAQGQLLHRPLAP